MASSLVLEDFLPYLLNRAGVKIGLAFSRDVAEHDVTLPMWRVLIALWEAGDQRLGDLAERTSIDISTLSRLLGTLQRRRLIARGRSGTDARALSVSLTDQGRALTEKIIPIARHYEEVAIRGISDTDLRRLKKLLIKLYSNIETFDREYEERQRRAAKANGAKRRPRADKSGRALRP